MDTFMAAVQTIVNEHREAEAIRILAQAMEEDMVRLRSEAEVANASLRVVRKINNGRNRCIDEICKRY